MKLFTTFILMATFLFFCMAYATSTIGAKPQTKGTKKPTIIKQLPKPLSVEDIIREEAKKAGLSQLVTGRFVKIAQCESTLNPKAYSRGNYGLFQINKTVWNKYIDGDLYDARYNSWFAFNIVYKKSNINAWSCARLI